MAKMLIVMLKSLFKKVILILQYGLDEFLTSHVHEQNASLQFINMLCRRLLKVPVLKRDAIDERITA